MLMLRRTASSLDSKNQYSLWRNSVVMEFGGIVASEKRPLKKEIIKNYIRANLEILDYKAIIEMTQIIRKTENSITRYFFGKPNNPIIDQLKNHYIELMTKEIEKFRTTHYDFELGDVNYNVALSKVLSQHRETLKKVFKFSDADITKFYWDKRSYALHEISHVSHKKHESVEVYESNIQAAWSGLSMIAL